MKTIFLLFLLLPAVTFCQTFLGVGVGNHHAINFYTGYQYKDKAEISIGYYASAFVSDKPVIGFIKAGYIAGNFTMAAGVANFNYSNNLKLPGKTGKHLLYSVEYGITKHTGKFYCNATYTGSLLYISAGIKAYIK